MTQATLTQTPDEWLLEQFDADPFGYLSQDHHSGYIASIKEDHYPECWCIIGDFYGNYASARWSADYNRVESD